MDDEKPWERFMRESNAIEGEFIGSPKEFSRKVLFQPPGRLNPGDEKAVMLAFRIGRIIKKEDILHLHSILGDYLKKDWVGKWREVNVTVGNYHPPLYDKVPELMEEYIKNFPEFDSWKAYNEFEKIHPFRDLNGRTGRLLWLSKAIDEGYSFQVSFERTYHYQNLGKYETNNF